MGYNLFFGALASALVEGVAIWITASIIAGRMRRAEIIERRLAVSVPLESAFKYGDRTLVGTKAMKWKELEALWSDLIDPPRHRRGRLR